MNADDIFHEKTYFYVWESELSKFISEHYKRPYSLQQSTELSQGSVEFLKVPDSLFWSQDGEDFVEWAQRDTNDHDEYHLEQLRTMTWERNYSPPIQPILNDLFNKGIIPEGTYLIHVWW